MQVVVVVPALLTRKPPRFAEDGVPLTGLCPGRWRRLYRGAGWILATLTLLLTVAAAGVVYYVHFDRSRLPDLEAFLRFEPSTTGEIHDGRGQVLIELAREYRQLVSHDEVPAIVQQAVLAAEDKRFYSHSGVEYRSLPRVAWTTVRDSAGAWWRGDGVRLRFPQGGSTLTQQLVRNYFLKDLTLRERGEHLVDDAMTSRVLAAGLGVRVANKLLRKLEEVRLALWLEDEMLLRFGSRQAAKREIFARYANLIYMGNGRYGFAAASEYYFDEPLRGYTARDAGKAALLAGISKSPRDYAPAPGNPRVLRRRNAILALMARDGRISETLARRCQAEPVSVAQRDLAKTDAPAAVASVLDELEQRGGHRFGVEDLFQGRIAVRTTVDARVQSIVNEELEQGLSRYEKRHGASTGLIQGSAVVLRNADAAILAEVGGRRVFQGRRTRYSDLNRVTGSLRQPGSTWKPMVYLAAFRRGLDLDMVIPDEPIDVPLNGNGDVKWIENYDNEFKGLIPARQALAESRNAAAVWIAKAVGVDDVNRTARQMGIRTPLHRYISTALGATEVRLRELADAYRAMASGIWADPYVVARVTDTFSGVVLYEASRLTRGAGTGGPNAVELSLIQEGLRGCVRLPTGTAHALDSASFPIPVMGKTGTTNDFRDALFVGSTYGPSGITVAVRIGFDDNRTLGRRETGSRAALPIFREIMLRLYQDLLVGPVPRFPQEIESRIDLYLTMNQPPAVLGLDAPEEPRLEGLVGWMGSKPDLEQPAAEVGAGN